MYTIYSWNIKILSLQTVYRCENDFLPLKRNENKIKYHGIYQIRMCETSECFIRMKFDKIILWEDWMNTRRKTERKINVLHVFSTLLLLFQVCIFREINISIQFQNRVWNIQFDFGTLRSMYSSANIMFIYIYLIYITRLSVFQLTKNLFLL